MDPATLTFAQALDLLRIPRTVGTDPETGEEMVAYNGKFGPYLKKGTDTRSLASEDQILTVTLPEAQALFAQPKQRRGRTAAAPAAGTGCRPGHATPRRGQRRAFRPLRDRRDDERIVAQGRRRGVDHHGARRPSSWPSAGPPALRPARRPGRKKAGKKAAKKATKKATGAKKSAGAAKKAAKKATGAKKSAASKKAAAERAVPLEPF